MISKNEIKILHCLYKNECSSPLKSFTILRLKEETRFKGGKVRYTIRPLLLAGYIKEGCQSGNASTYYITQEGKKAIEEVLK